MSYQEALTRFGTDKPDTRYGLELKDVTSILGNGNIRIFQDAVNKGAHSGIRDSSARTDFLIHSPAGAKIFAISAPGMAGLPKSEQKAIEDEAKKHGVPVVLFHEESALLLAHLRTYRGSHSSLSSLLNSGTRRWQS
jgi:hypothetical protein